MASGKPPTKTVVLYGSFPKGRPVRPRSSESKALENAESLPEAMGDAFEGIARGKRPMTGEAALPVTLASLMRTLRPRSTKEDGDERPRYSARSRHSGELNRTKPYPFDTPCASHMILAAEQEGKEGVNKA